MEARNRQTRILFLGNSLVYYNDMPGTLEALALAAGKNVFVDSVTKGSATMAQFADRSTEIGAAAYAKLTQSAWDFVIAEPSRRITPEEDSVLAAETAAAKVLKELAGAAGAELLFYDVFGNNDGKPGIFRMTAGPAAEKTGFFLMSRQEHTAFLHRVNLRISREVGGVRLIPAGLAFEEALRDAPDIGLYHTDNRHPSPEGSYLAACLVFNVLFGEKTAGIRYDGGLPFASVLREIADRLPELQGP